MSLRNSWGISEKWQEGVVTRQNKQEIKNGARAYRPNAITRGSLGEYESLF